MFKKLEKPTALPPLPPLELLSRSSAPGELLDQWVEQREEIHRANGELFERGLKIMKRCAFINGMLGRPLNLHFSWCPHSDWDEYWQDQGWPALPELK